MIKRKGYLNILLGGILASSLLLNTTIYAIDNTNKNDLSNNSVQIDNKEKNNNDSVKENISNNAKVSDTLNEKENSNVSNDSKAVDKIKSGWQEIEGNWYYFNSNGNMKTGWEEINGYWYYFNNDGIMQTGWQEIGGKWYYFRPDGNMRVGWEQINGYWYYFGSDGSMQTGWQEVGGIWYYFRPDGNMRIGWEEINGYWYYFNGDGVMQTGWQEIGGVWYYFRPDGNMRIGWEEINGYWYYFGSNGAMQTGWQELGGTWYYFRTDGNMKVGWEEIDGKWYYFATDGVLETNKVVGDWYVNNDGVGNQIVTEGVYGKSGKGRDLEYYRIGHGKKVLFSVFGVHGYEDAWSGDSQELKIIAEKSVNRLRSEYNTKGIDLSEWSVYIIPSANPDGRIDGWTNNGPGRTTVTTKNDINRSFPTGFTPFYSARNYTGPTALGSPEAKALYGFINKTMEGATEKVLLDVHGWENKTIGNPSIAKYFDNEFGFRNINKYPGGFVITYGNAIGAKSVLVEFPVPYSHQDILRRDFSGKFANGLVNILLNN
ncbi:M14 family zinc carboxypeptidase [Clostridium perfringens]|uniref:M14 family zinc carboxypeptidase n=1 Tax=Clostridium perfringens TaxID=1502 RepID=UPI00016BD62A|nr:M14 family zinc carboxypeptidase [Clostridium perfringens]MDH2459968.1 M14 family zinc carboxypeptidase [Clostridium perfringens]MDK0581283.1 M14 family zinc carboxypeptidase [Clostridium perfringens]MDK0797486.1 M14 family zinc carboxypeptidase [Clostridium perfringens]MDK0901524.1 M14 family zinc carboxypeptidase [Clostridium perfringens]MDM0769119.1 M14 family zinc carboxypeptidase [Clostridium perfringens]